MATIGGNIKRAREAAGIKTQTALAKSLGVPQPQLSDWENDRYGAPDTKTLMRIAATIPCAFDALVQGLDAQYDASRDLVGHGSGVQLAPSTSGGPGVQSADRILEEHVKHDRRLALEVQEVIGRLGDIVERLENKIGTPSGRKTLRAPRHRTAR